MRYPCLLCGLHNAQLLCAGCQDDLPHYLPDANQRLCLCCGQMFSGTAAIDYCGACLTQAPPFERLYARFFYHYPIKQLLHQAKYHVDLTVLHQLAQLTQQSLPADFKADCVMPVPMHPWHLRVRGFNHAVFLAKKLGQWRNIAVDYRSCRCVKLNQRQSLLPAKQRAENVRGVFQVKKNLNYSHVLLVDDVVTTGATVSELSKVLLKAGVQRISVCCCARTVGGI